MNKPIDHAQCVRKAIALSIADQPSHVVGVSRRCLWGRVAHHLYRLAPDDLSREEAETLYAKIVCEGRFSKFVYPDTPHPPTA